jgi:hypothetical protein
MSRPGHLLPRVAALSVLSICSIFNPGRSLGTELGFDAGATLQLVDNDDRNIISVATPAPGNVGVFSVQTARVGFRAGQAGEIEPSLGFSLISEEQFGGGRRTLAHLLMGASYLRYLTHEKTGSLPYLRAGGQWRQLTATNVPALTQFGVGGGIGMLWRSERVLGVRLQTTATRWFENDDFLGHWDLGIALGLSAFTN